MSTAHAACLLGLGLSASVAGAGAQVPDELEVLVVTARHRSERWEEAPLTVTVRDAAAREAQGAQDLVDHLRAVPGVLAAGVSPQGRASSLAVRGIQYGSTNPAGDPSVALFVDGIYQSQSRLGVLAWFDVDELQVLRGPQVTLFGRNAFAGAIHLQTRQPVDELQANVDARWASYGGQGWNAVLNGALPGVGVLARFAAVAYASEGQGRSIRNPGQRLGGEDVLAARLTLASQPADDWQWSLKLESLADRSAPSPVQNASTTVAQATPVLPAQALGRIPGSPPNGLTAPPHYADVFVPDGQRSRADQDLAQLRVEAPRLWGGRFTLNAAYQRARDSVIVDPASVGDQAYNNQYFATDLKTRSLEMRWLGTPTDTLLLLLGVHHLDDDLSYGNITFSQYAPLLASNAQVLASQRRRSSGLFAELEWRLAEQWRLSVAGRQMQEFKDFAFNRRTRTRDLPPAQWLPASAWERDAKRWNDFSPRVSLDWRPGSGNMLYASWTQGFKSGGYTVQAASLAGTGPYDPERITATELGYKHRDTEHGLQWSMVAFDNQLRDLQRTITRSQAGVLANRVVNAASARTRGLELDLTWQADARTELQGGLALLDAGYGAFCGNIGFPGAGPACGTQAGELDNSALPLSHAPAYQWNAGVRRQLWAGGSGRWSAGLEVSRSAALHTSDTPYPVTRRDALLQVDAGLQWVSGNGAMHAGLQAYNLLDDIAVQQAIRSGNTLTVLGHTARRRVAFVLGARW
jgi:iron complex outermembrane recepter protein